MYLSLHVHDNNSVGPVADNKVLLVLGQQVDTIDSNVCSSQGLECVDALCWLNAPHFHCTITARTKTTHQVFSVVPDRLYVYVTEDRLYVYVKEERLLLINDKNTQNKSLLISFEIYQSLYKLCKKPTWECCVHLHWTLLHLRRSCGPWTPSVFYQTSTRVFCKSSTKILKQNIKPIMILI